MTHLWAQWWYYEVIRNRTLEQKNLYVHLMSALTHYLTLRETIKSDDWHQNNKPLISLAEFN